MTTSLDDFSIKIGTILGNLDVVFRDISEIRQNAQFSLTQNTDTVLRLAVLENQQKAVQEIKSHLSTLVPLSNSKLEFIESSFEDLSEIINSLESSVNVVKAILERDIWSPNIADMDDKLVIITQVLAEAKAMFVAETLSKPTNRSMLLELCHRDSTGDKWTWSKQLTHALEENFLVKVAEGILIILAILFYGFIERNYKSDEFKKLELSNQQLQVEIQKLHNEEDTAKKQRGDNQEEVVNLLDKNFKGIDRKR